MPWAFGLGLAQCWKKHAGKDGDNGNDYQKFDQRKAFYKLGAIGGSELFHDLGNE